MIHNHYELLIYLGDILKEDADAIVMPADPDLSFKQKKITRTFQAQKHHLEKEIRRAEADDHFAIKYNNFSIPSARICYFCQVPCWTGVSQRLKIRPFKEPSDNYGSRHDLPYLS